MGARRAIRASKSMVEHARAIGRVVVMSEKAGGTEWEGGKKDVEKVDGELGKEMWQSEQIHSQEHIQKHACRCKWGSRRFVRCIFLLVLPGSLNKSHMPHILLREVTSQATKISCISSVKLKKTKFTKNILFMF